MPFEGPAEWDRWLDQNHDTSSGVWLRLFKKASGVPSITHAQALEEALCYGWIDGQGRKYDDTSWLQKFTPRRAKSVWSKRNTEHATRLIDLGKMKPGGLREVEAAQADGRWARAYDAPSTMEIPEDFLQELSGNAKAKAFFETLNKTNTYAIAWRLQTARKPETRERRMRAIIAMLEQGKRLYD